MLNGNPTSFPAGSAGGKAFRRNPRPHQDAPPGKSPRILVIRAGAMGDTLMATPLVRALRRTYPNAYLAFLCSGTGEEVLRHNPHLDEVISLTHRHLPAWLSPEKSRLLGRLARLELDWLLALESHPNFLELARRAKAQRTIAYAALPAARGFERAEWDPRRHAIENHLRAADPLGVRPSGLEMELYYPPALDELMRRRLGRAGISSTDRLVGIHPGWGSRRHSLHQTRLRSWPPDRFAHVVRMLAETAGAKVVLTGSSADRPLTEFIARRAGVSCLNLAGDLEVLELAALVHRLQLYVTVDSGPAHMAAALGTPLVTLWGPAIIEQTQPLAARGPVRVLYERPPCAPCYGTPLMKSCRDNICMKRIETAQVEEAIRLALGSETARLA